MVGEPTSTRTTIRQKIARELRMPFARRFNSSSVLTGTPTALILQDSRLIEEDGDWEGAWVYITSGSAIGDVREIRAFMADEDKAHIDYPLTETPAAGDSYEIHSVFNAYEIHDAINEAIGEGWPSFWDAITSEELVIQDDTLTYDLSELDTAPWIIRELWVEQVLNVIRGTVASSTNTTVTITDSTLTDVQAGWFISIYDNTGKGQLRTIVSVSGDEITVATWTTNPDTTSFYAIWDPADEKRDWYRIFAAHFDTREFPSKLYLTRRYPALNGMRIRILYLAQPAELSADTDTTLLPNRYIISKALSILQGRMIQDNRADRQKAREVAAKYWEEAEQYKTMKAWSLPPITIWQEDDITGNIPNTDPPDPLGWR